MNSYFNPIKEAVEAELSAALKLPITIRDATILGNRSAITFRIWTTPAEGVPATFILKHLDLKIFEREKRAQKAHLDFMKELTAYEFFESIYPAFNIRARMIASRTENPSIMILEDLGDKEDALAIGFEETQKKLGHSLATLNVATQPQIENYQKLLHQKLGCIKDREHHLSDINKGIATLNELLEHQSKKLSKDFKDGLEKVRTTLEQPGPFYTLIHHDMINNRQCILKEGTYHLIDFEKSTTASSLLDISRAIIPKMEYNRRIDRYVLSGTGFSDTLINSHRETLKEKSTKKFDPVLWEYSLGAAFIYTTIAEIGRIAQLIEKKRKFLETPVSCLQKLIQSLNKYTVRYTSFHFMTKEMNQLIH